VFSGAEDASHQHGSDVAILLKKGMSDLKALAVRLCSNNSNFLRMAFAAKQWVF